MQYKNNVKKLMEEYNYSLNKLNETCELSLNTLRKLKNNPFHNFNLESAYQLAQAFDCSIKDIIEDDASTINFDKIAEKNKNTPLFSNNQVFSPANIKYLKKLLSEVGVLCNISTYSLYTTANIKDQQEFTPISVDFNLLVTKENTSTLFIRDFFVSVNKNLFNEEAIKDAIIKAFELYARKLKINQICFRTFNDSERFEDTFREALSLLPYELPSNFSCLVEPDPSTFIKNKFERDINTFFLDDTVLWRKSLV